MSVKFAAREVRTGKLDRETATRRCLLLLNRLAARETVLLVMCNVPLTVVLDRGGTRTRSRLYACRWRTVTRRVQNDAKWPRPMAAVSAALAQSPARDFTKQKLNEKNMCHTLLYIAVPKGWT